MEGLHGTWDEEGPARASAPLDARVGAVDHAALCGASGSVAGILSVELSKCQ